MSKFVELQSFYKNVIDPAPVPGTSEVGHFNIFKVEDLRFPKKGHATYSRRDFFKISLVTGHGKIHYADQSIEVPESVLVFTNPMIPYYWEIIGEEQTGYVCIFTEAFFNRFNHISEFPVFQETNSAVVLLNKDDTCRFNELFLRMYNELHGDYIYKYDLLRSLLMELIHSAQKMQPAHGSKQTGSNAADRITTLFNELLERQFPVELSNQKIKLNTPSAFAKQLNIHVNHLNKALKETTGQTTTQLINARLIQEAKILLKSTKWTIAEIGWCLGFEEPNHFSGFFKNKTKITPMKFRQSVID